MPTDRLALSPEVAAQLERELRQREKTIIDGLLQQPDYPPLPCCPECHAAVEEISSMRDFATDDTLINVQPCGHRFRVAPLDAA